MKRITYLKTLLVGLCAMVATSAWAQTTTTYDFEDGEKLFTEDSRITAAVVSGNQTIYNQEFELDGKAVSFTGASNAQNGYCFAHFDFSSLCAQAAKVKVEFETVLGNGARSIISVGDAAVRGTTGNSGKTAYSAKGAIFRIGTDKNYSYVNATNVGASTVVSQKWLKVTVEVDEVEKKYTYSVVDKATSNVLYSNGEEPIAFYNSDAANCTQIDMFGYINNSQMGLIDNLSITVTKDEREQANYTVKFVDGDDNEIKDAATREGAVGDGIVLLSADKEVYWNEGGKKYFYVSDNSEGAKIASDGSTVVTIVYREAEVWNYTVNFVAEGDINLGSKTGTGFEGDQMSVPYSKYLVNDGQLYMKDRGLSTNSEFNYKFNLDADNKTTSITYAAVEAVTNVIFCSEAEDIEGLVKCNSSNAGIRSSNSAGAYAPNNTILTSLSSGTYQIKLALYDATKDHNSSWTFLAGDKELFTVDCSDINYTEYEPVEFTLTENENLVVRQGGGNVVGLDALYITSSDGSIIETVPLSVELGTTGYSTFSSPFAVEIPSDVTAYTAEVNETGTYVNFTKVEETAIPAKTGVLLKGNANASVDFNIISSAAALSNKNDFKVNTSGATFAVAENTTYFAMVKDSDPLKFGTVNPSSVAIPANKAYLAVVGNSEARLTVTFDGETTAIKSIENAETSNAIYNLNGQRVEKAQKGLYIVNGKKTIVK